MTQYIQLSRRAFVRQGTLVLTAGAVCPIRLCAADAPAPLQFALVTDLHHADKPSAGARFYRQTLTKLAEAAQQFATDQPDFAVELGDLIDAADSVETELSYLTTIDREFSKICPDRVYVLGNHCVDTLKKEEFLQAVKQPQSYFSFDRKGLHCVVLDACFRSDGQPYGRKNSRWNDANIPAAEVEWLVADLAATEYPVVVFAHQRLDVTKSHSVNNHAQIRQVLEDSGKVLAVFQGHSHANDLQEINGIHYCTMVAMVEGSGPEHNGYSRVQFHSDRTLTISGFRKQHSYQWPSP